VSAKDQDGRGRIWVWRRRERYGGIGAALAPALTDLAFGRQTLGGAEHDCKIVDEPARALARRMIHVARQ
jgi:hypothetical protein